LVAGGGPARAQDPDSVRRQVEQIRAAMFLESAQVGTEARRLVSEGRSATQVLQWQNEQIRQIGDRAVAAMQRLKDGPVKPPAVSPNKPLLVGVWRSATRDDAGITWVRNLSSKSRLSRPTAPRFRTGRRVGKSAITKTASRT
jgi:hypothetical protein